MKKVTVFCGSSFGTNKLFKNQAFLLGQTLANQNIELIYGGARVGLMGAVANGTLSKNGKVTGILTSFLSDKELAHQNLTNLIITETMHERKAKMSELCDAIITLPGGYGTLEEFFEMMTWGSLSLHKKPIALLNTAGFYNELLGLIETMVKNGFLNIAYQEMLIVDENIDALLLKMQNYTPPTLLKWKEVREIF